MPAATAGLGLCHRCLGRRGVRRAGDFFGGYRLAAEPTGAPPGSPEKVDVMARRAQEVVSIFHPLDTTWGAA